MSETTQKAKKALADVLDALQACCITISDFGAIEKLIKEAEAHEQEQNDHTDFLHSQLQLWAEKEITAPANELQSIQGWLSHLGHYGAQETAKMMRTRMLLLMEAATKLSSLGKEAEDKAGIYKKRSRASLESNLYYLPVGLTQDIAKAIDSVSPFDPAEIYGVVKVNAVKYSDSLIKDYVHLRIVGIAQCAYAVNQAYCQQLGDMSMLGWDNETEAVRTGYFLGVHAKLSKNLSPEQQHEMWCQSKFADGWKYGPVKNVEQKLNPALVDYSELPKEQKMKDFLFHAVVDSLKGLCNV